MNQGSGAAEFRVETLERGAKVTQNGTMVDGRNPALPIIRNIP